MTKLIIVIVVVIALVGGGVYLASNNSNKPAANNNSTDNNQTKETEHNANQSNDSSSNAVATNTVAIDNMAFAPASITVKKGTTVTWTNNDSVAHDVTQTDGKSELDSGVMTTGQSYSYTFDSTGTFEYFCSLHPNMVGTVTVTE